MSKVKTDILSLDDVQVLVNAFYSKVRNNEIIGPIFNERIEDRWPLHLEKMYRFWQTVLLTEHTYFGSPFPPHAHLPVGKAHFDVWLGIFNETVDAHFTGEKANEAKWRASKMATMFLSKIAYYKNNPATPLI